MKTRYYIFGCLVALMGVMLGLYGCTDEFDDFKYSGRPSDVISFTASLRGSRSASVARSSSGRLEIEEEEWLVGRDKNVSRGNPVTLLKDTAGVIGYEYDGSLSLLSSLSNKKFVFDGDALNAVSDNVRWKTIQKDSVLFYVYAPYQSNVTYVFDSLKNVKVNDDVTKQQDLIVASWQGKKGKNYGERIQTETIPLTFEHALTGVKFKVGFNCTVTQLKVKNIYRSGTYKFGKGWSVNKDSTDYVFNFNNKVCTANTALTDSVNTLMMIPQTLSDSAKVVLYYDSNDSIVISMKDKVWQEGKMITYTIHKDAAPSYIYFDLAAGSIDIQKATSDTITKYGLEGVTINDIIYIGSIYVKGQSRRFAGIHKQGNNNALGNHYYVYQSSEDNDTRNTKLLTGYKTENDFNNKTNCTIPSYAPVMYNGQLWSDFITNNKNDSLVFAVWDNDKGAGKATSNNAYYTKPNKKGKKGAVRDVGREATKNRIHIEGDVGEINLFIDNIYSSFQERGASPKRDRTLGGISFIPSWETSSGESVLTINIIGDNRLGCVNYQNNDSLKNWLVFEGTGSLTVGDVDYYTDNEDYGSNRSCSVIGGADTPTKYEDVYNIKFNSGVIYAGARKSGCTAIGGGGNGDTKIIINGGTITAVTATTGTAIGGGSGLVQPGGKGDVTIKGGNIYTYNFLNRSKVPSSAIGGAGSRDVDGSLGKVGIHGGYVYAYSENGTAIGGGSSANTQGGNAEITISGGQVIAVSGNGAGIGGGSACTGGGNSSYNGGTAIVIISGNPIIRTGSIGGGTTGAKKGKIGSANINISGGDIQAQFVMAAGSDSIPKFNMSGGLIRNSDVSDSVYIHTSKKGGAVYLEDGTFTMSGGTIKNCSAVQGGAVYIESSSGNSQFKMTGGEIISCFATGDQNDSGHGGAVCLNGGLVEMLGGKIWKNYSENGNGGAIYISNGNFTMNNNAEISGNSAQHGNGGGVFVSSTGSPVFVDLKQGIIKDNTANHYGGGICVDMGSTNYKATVTVGSNNQGDENPRISDNMSMLAGGGLYVRGDSANITINSGMIDENKVSAYVRNENVANEGGMVELNGGRVTHSVVIFNPNSKDATTPSDPYMQKIVKDTNSKLNPNRFVRDAYNFMGWNTHTDSLRGTNYADKAIMNTSQDTIRLYAKWKFQGSTSGN